MQRASTCSQSLKFFLQLTLDLRPHVLPGALFNSGRGIWSLRFLLQQDTLGTEQAQRALGVFQAVTVGERHVRHQDHRPLDGVPI
jgi:hypothetical protein